MRRIDLHSSSNMEIKVRTASLVVILIALAGCSNPIRPPLPYPIVSGFVVDGKHIDTLRLIDTAQDSKSSYMSGPVNLSGFSQVSASFHIVHGMKYSSSEKFYFETGFYSPAKQLYFIPVLPDMQSTIQPLEKALTVVIKPKEFIPALTDTVCIFIQIHNGSATFSHFLVTGTKE